MTKYLLIAIVALSMLLSAVINQSHNRKVKADRMENNFTQMSNDNKMLNIRYSELDTRRMSVIDSLAKIIKTKPTRIIEYVNVYIVDTIVDTINITLLKQSDTVFLFSERFNCLTIDGQLSISNNEPELLFNNMVYTNDVKYVVYLARVRRKVWFFNTKLFGRKEAKLEIIPECGTVTIETVKLIK